MPFFPRWSHSESESRSRSKTNEGETKRSEVETSKRYYLDPPVQLENTARAVALF